MKSLVSFSLLCLSSIFLWDFPLYVSNTVRPFCHNLHSSLRSPDLQNYFIIVHIRVHFLYYKVLFSSATQSCPTLCYPMDCSMLDLPVHHQCLIKVMSIESKIPSNHLNLCCRLLLLPSIFLSFRVFSNESALLIRWPKYWTFNFSISPSNEYSGLISFRMDWLDLLAIPRDSSVFSNTIVRKHQFFGAQLSL